MKNRYFNLFALPLLLALLSGCGKNGFVKNASVSDTTDTSGDAWVNVSLALNTGIIALPDLSFPIFGGFEESMGRVSLSREGLDISADVSKVTHSNFLDGHDLPNGRPIPIGGLSQVPVLAIHAGVVILYVSLSDVHLMVGAALPIEEFGPLSPLIGLVKLGFNLMPSFKIGRIQGVGGLYLGTANGLAFFVDASSLLPQQGTKVTSLGQAALQARADLRLDAVPELDYSGEVTDSSKESALLNGLAQLGEKKSGAPLTVGSTGTVGQ